MTHQIIIGVSVCVALIALYVWLGGRGQMSLSSLDPTAVFKPIQSQSYRRWIFVKGTTEAYVLRMIKEYGALSPSGDERAYRFELAQTGEWLALQVDERLSFYVYHNLMCWLLGYQEGPDQPERAVGFAQSLMTPDEDYLFYLDPESGGGDTQIVVFRSGESVSVYLPEAYEEQGNMCVRADLKLSMEERAAHLRGAGLDLTTLDALSFMERRVQMSVEG